MSSLFIFLGTGFVLYLLFRFARKLFYKALLIVLFVAGSIFGLYYYKIGPFKKNVAHISVIKEKYCDGQRPEICDCIITPLEADIKTRFSTEEIDSMKDDRVNSAYVFEKSMFKISSQSKSCLKAKGKEELWGQFIKETLQLDNAVTDKVQSLLQEGKTIVEQKVEDAKEKKTDIDDRY